jgi:HTH-type transcriptional regulator / antitoxin HipB
MESTKMKSYSLDEMKDKYIGTVASKDRDEYEYELCMEVHGSIIKPVKQKLAMKNGYTESMDD